VRLTPDHNQMCSSRRQPTRGRYDSRMDALFECECGMDTDRNVNASIDLLQTAVSKRLEMAGGLWFSPGAFQHDVMMTFYDLEKVERSEPNGTSCIREGDLNRSPPDDATEPRWVPPHVRANDGRKSKR
jgi:hypothetical protein